MQGRLKPVLRELMVLTAVVGLLGLWSCGGGSDGGSAVPGAAVPVSAGDSTVDVLVDGVERPTGVDAQLWDELTVELKRVLAKTGSADVPSQPPANEYNAVSDLAVVVNLGGTATFTWHYRNTGDYNQDKAVTANDLTGVGQQYEQSTTDGVDDARQQVVDGNRDGLITVNDITPIGQNFNRQVDGYALETSTTDLPGSGWELAAAVTFADSELPEDRGWRTFTLEFAEAVDGRYYRVAPYYADTGTTGVESNTVQFDISAAGIPQNVTASQGSVAGGVRIAWSELAGAHYYNIWRHTAEVGDYVLLGETGSSTTEYLDNTAEPGGHYWYKVRGMLSGGWSDRSDAAEGWAMEPPAAPTSLSASDGDYADRIALSWDPVTVATGYSIHRSLMAGSGYSQVATADTTSHDDTTAVPGTVYYYVVMATNPAGSSPPGNEAAGRRAVAGLPPVVESVAPLNGVGGSTVAFAAVVSGGTPDTYAWYFDGGTVPGSSASVAPEVWLGLPSSYDCWLTVTNGYGGDTFNFTLTVTDPGLAPVITGVSPTAGASTEILTFNATLIGGTPDEWEWNFGGGANPDTSSEESPVVELSAMGSYNAWVRAANGTGEDTFPFTLNVGDVPPPPYDPPTEVSATAGTSTTLVTLTWTRSIDATGYQVFRDSPATLVATLGDVATWNDTTLGDYQQHTYWLKATGPAGTSDFSDSDTGWRRLPAPTGLTATDGDFLNHIRLRWTKVTGAAGYTLYRDGGELVALGDVDVWDDSSVGDHASHSYTVRGDNALGQSADSTADTGYVGLAAPTGLSASDGSHTDRIALSWTKSTGATGYQIHRDSSLLQTVGDVAAWDDTAVGDHAQHTYEVRGTNSLDSSDLSGSDTGYVGLGVPTGLAASDGSHTDRIALSWTKSSGATGYDIYRDNQSNLIQTVGDIAAWDDGTVGDHASHTYWLKATNSLGESGFSASDTGHRRLTAPTGLSASDGSHTDRIRLTWTKSTEATGYKVYRDSSLVQTVGDVATWDDTGVSDCNQHTYEVKATNALGDSDPSASDTGYRRILAPTGLAATDGDYRTKVQLTWNAVTAATGYKIYRDNQSTLIDTVGAVTSYDDETLSDYLAHDYWLKAIGPCGDSDFSASDSGHRSQYAWREHVVDTSASVGEGSCLRVVNGVPMVSFRDSANGDVKFARSSEATPDELGDWTVYTLDTSGTVGQYMTTLAALGGVPAVAYYDSNNPGTTNPNLKVAIAGSGTPGSGDWAFHYVDETLVNGRYPSMVVADGKLAIAYQYFTAKDVKLARASIATPTQTSDWAVHTVASSGNLGNDGICLAVHGGRFVVTFCKAATGAQVHLARADVAEPATITDWSTHYIETGDLGQYSSVTTWNGNLAVSYLSNASARVRFARATADPPTADTDWVVMDIDTTHLSGLYGTSLVIDPDGYPGIAFHYAADADLMYSGTTDSACDDPGDWTTVTVDDGAAAGFWPSMTTVNGVPAMTYQAGGNLKYAVYVPD